MDMRILPNKELSEQHTQMLEDANHCSLCGTPLMFQHHTDYLKMTVREQAHCPSCHIRSQPKEFILQ